TFSQKLVFGKSIVSAALWSSLSRKPLSQTEKEAKISALFLVRKRSLGGKRDPQGEEDADSPSFR
ncbi:MAG: hypothetical protein MJ070_09610, partial [Lachnospiraceae bacterium]|nr:hypothetical protein [Lachnospiraceae bacterium]